MKQFENNLDNLGLLIQKYEEIFNIVIEDQKKKHKTLPDETFIILMLFRKITERLDAIFILLENKSENAAKSISRDLIENVLYFIYVIESKDKHKTRALSYYYSNFKDQINLSKLLTSKNERGNKIRAFLNVKNDEGTLINKAKKAEEYFLGKLKDEKYTNIKVEWDRFEKKKNIKYPNWYSLFNGPKNIRELAKWCGYEVEYELLYGIYSRQVHSANVMDQFENVNGLAGIKNLREYDNPTLEFIFSFSLGIESLNKFVDFFDMNHKVKIEKWIKNIMK